jgi:hypothetical protein
MAVVVNLNAPIYTGFIVSNVGTSALAPLSGLSNDATIAHITFEGSALRFRLDGTTAHSATGHLASAGDVLDLQGGDVLKGFRVICPTVTGTLMISVGHP